MRFESTIWTQIRRAREGNESAINQFVMKYRLPIMSFIMKNGFSEHDAEDLSQEVFMRIFRDNILSKADESKGRFRDLILAVTRNIIREKLRERYRKKRMPEEGIISMDQEIIKSCRDEEFDRMWLQNILKLALDRLEEESKQKGLLYFSTIKILLEEGPDYKLIARRLSKTPQEINNYIHRARQKLIGYIRDEIASYSSSHEEYEDEIRYLARFLKI